MTPKGSLLIGPIRGAPHKTNLLPKQLELGGTISEFRWIVEIIPTRSTVYKSTTLILACFPCSMLHDRHLVAFL